MHNFGVNYYQYRNSSVLDVIVYQLEAFISRIYRAHILATTLAKNIRAIIYNQTSP